MGDATVERKPSFIKGLKGEFKKIVWPKFSVLMKQTWVVIIVSLIVGLLITGIDLLYGFGFDKIFIR